MGDIRALSNDNFPNALIYDPLIALIPPLKLPVTIAIHSIIAPVTYAGLTIAKYT